MKRRMGVLRRGRCSRRHIAA
ncbi:MAG: hypothetical protein QOI94_285, partial [Acidobacteriaceae bacterium]|nr:hypothetical protein [Acidobacteriaceae bacterium]